MRLTPKAIALFLLPLLLAPTAACAGTSTTSSVVQDQFGHTDKMGTAAIGGKTFVVLPADPPQPVHWTNFGEPYNSYYGVTAYSNGKAKGSARKYQCTELIHRYVSTIYGFPSRIGLGMGNGNALASGIAIYFRGQTKPVSALDGKHVALEFFEGGKTTYPPVVGSIISMHFNLSEKGPGHVAILRDLTQDPNGSLIGTLFAQHGALPLKIGAEVPPDQVIFTKDKDGHWGGIVDSPFFKTNFRIAGWTTAVVAP